jgi:hypothetical protein
MSIYHLRLFMLAYLIIAHASVVAHMQETVGISFKFEDVKEVKNFALDIDIIETMKTINNLIKDMGVIMGK